ncbi:MAG: DUF188 domain-containing protein [Betaproteobacteria bacterium]|nr:DUF188 domain-containing protein [Betaproteobacteria bacterium]
MDQMRSSGVNTGGPAPFFHNDRKTFSNRLDKFLARHRQP